MRGRPSHRGADRNFLLALAIAGAEISINNSGIYKRNQQVTDTDFPPDATAGMGGDPTGGEIELVKAGMTPSEARATREALMAWLNRGGTLKAATNLSQPLPLFRGGNLFTPTFDGPLEFLAATKTQITN